MVWLVPRDLQTKVPSNDRFSPGDHVRYGPDRLLINSNLGLQGIFVHLACLRCLVLSTGRS